MLHQPRYRILDASTSIFFARELEHVKSKTFDVLYGDLKFRELFPVNNETHPGATSVAYEVYDRRGRAKIIAGYGGDLPRVDVSGRLEEAAPIRIVGASFGYNQKEIRSSAMTGKSLDQKRANTARRAVEEELNDIAFLGDAATGLEGLLTASGVPTANVPNGAGGDPEWTTKTPDEILADINSLFTETAVDTLEKEKPTHVLMPTAQYNLIATTARSTTSDTTIMEYVVNKSPFLSGMDNIISVPQLSGAGTAGVDIMFAYTRHPDKVEFEIPEELVMLPEQEKGLEIEVPVFAQTGGLIVYFPLSMRAKESI